MAKKFFYNRVYNTKRNITNAVIIGACIIGVIICFIFVSTINVEDHTTDNGNLSIKNEVTVEVNQEFEKDIFFSKIDNVSLDDINVKYDLNYDISKVGRYNVTLEIAGKEHTSILNVVDTMIPSLVLKDLEIKTNEEFSADDFVSSCSDNSNSDCIVYFNGIDEDGNSIDYSKYTEAGKYQIKITAEDEAGNQTTKDATLTIIDAEEPNGNDGNGGNENPDINEPIVCKYGDNSYDKETYLIAIDITANDCAISLDLYRDETMTVGINKLMDTETTRIKKDVEELNLSGTLALNRKVTAVINTSGSGIVGYELKMSVTITHEGETKTIAEYKVDNEGKRVFIENPHNLGV